MKIRVAKGPRLLEHGGLFAILRTAVPWRSGALARAPRWRAGVPACAWVLGISCICLALACERRTRASQLEDPPAPAAKPKAKEATPVLDVSLAYPNVEAVGAKKRIHWEKTAPSDARSAPDAWKLDFEKSGGFAGVCWKNKLGNEGEAPGDDLSKARYRRISFWAKGAAGGEVAEFRAGGLGNVKTRYQESFDVSAGKIRLTPSWSEYAIYVMDADLSSVMTPFCVLFHREDNAEHTVIYVDDIQYGG
jgi:hypothetical protein